MGFFTRLFGGGGGRNDDAHDAAPAGPPPSWVSATGPRRPWIIGCQATGAVIFEAGEKEIILAVLPVADRAVFKGIDKLSLMAKVMKVRRVIVCNAGDDGHLAGTSIARACGLGHVYAIDATRPIDRGGSGASTEKPVEVRALGALQEPSLYVERRGNAIYGLWRDGGTFLCGHPMSFIDLAKSQPEHAVGKLLLDGVGEPGVVDVFLKLKQVIIPANVPGFEATRLAKALSKMGARSTVANADVPGGTCDTPAGDASPAATTGEPRRERVLAHMTMGDLDAADTLAAEAIAAGDDVVDMHHQRAMIALMRGDETTADAHLSKIDTPQSLISRAIIAAHRGDRSAIELAHRGLAGLPGDIIAIRGAIIAHVLVGEPAKARAILEDHQKHLDREVVLALAKTIDEPPRQFRHNFPEHASLVYQAVKPMIDKGDYAMAEPLLRRAVEWDPENLEIAADLGFTLSKLERDDEAMAVYDAAIARGGTRQLLRFNRGNCQLRRQRYGEAAADFRACVDLKADWHEARVNLVSALYAKGDRQAARTEIDQLKKLGGPPQFVTSLEQMLAGTL
jgi:Tfp pilus assembly protein PilF